MRRPRSRAEPRRAARAGPGSVDRVGRRCGSTGRPRNDSAAATASARLLRPVSTTVPAPDERASGSHSGSQSTTVAPGCDDRELLDGDLLPRLAELRGVLEADVGQHDDRLRGGRSSRRAARRARPRRPPRRRPAPRTRRARPRSAPRTGSRRRARPPAARARPPARTPPRRCRAARASPTRAARCSAPTRSPSARRSAAVSRVVVDLPFVPTTWIDGIGELRVAELGEQRAHPVEPELLGPRRERRDPVSRRDGVELAAVAASFSRSASTTSGGAF